MNNDWEAFYAKNKEKFFKVNIAKLLFIFQLG